MMLLLIPSVVRHDREVPAWPARIRRGIIPFGPRKERKIQNDRHSARPKMSLTGAKANVARTAHLTAWARALGRLLAGGLPGAVGYFNARTQYFDAVLLQEARAGLEQLVILGAGFDSRSLRFSDALQRVRVFEVDMPEVLALRAQLLLDGQPSPRSAIAVQ